MMFTHAKLALLNKYSGDNAFDSLISEITANQQEGNNYFELPMSKLEEEVKFDLINALEVMGYVVDYDKEYQSLTVYGE